MGIIDIAGKFDKIDREWTPFIVSEVNGQYIKIAKLMGDFIWHQHAEEDELFYVFQGELILEMRDSTVRLSAGQMYLVKKGVEHKPRTGPDGAQVILFEPKSTLHTGDVASDRTVSKLNWI
jgi:mannose-6-phosphate isomerase-like protein (cupin superfamily)